MNSIAMVMPLRNEKAAALDTLLTLAQSRVGDFFDLLLVQEKTLGSISVLDFDLGTFNRQTLGRLQMVDASLGADFDYGRLINHGIKITQHPLVIPLYPGVLLTRRFLLTALHYAHSDPSIFDRALPIVPCLTTGCHNQVPAAWGKDPGQPGQWAGATPILVKEQFRSVNGYDENPKTADKDADLLLRLTSHLNLPVYNLVELHMANFLRSEALQPTAVDSAITLAPPGQAALQLRKDDLPPPVNGDGWGEICAEYETGY